MSLLEFSLPQDDLLLFFQGPSGDSERHLKFFNKPNGVNAHLCNQEPQLTLKINYYSQDLRFFSSQENKNNSTWHLLSAYNMPGTVRISISRSTHIHTHIHILLIVLKVTYSCPHFLFLIILFIFGCAGPLLLHGLFSRCHEQVPL